MSNGSAPVIKEGRSDVAMKAKKAILLIREAARLSQREFGLIIGRTERRVRQIEFSGGRFSLSTNRRIYKRFRAQMDELGIAEVDLYHD